MAVTTTHDLPGSGRPRLILAKGGDVLTADGAPTARQVEFPLAERTSIGSSSACDVRLEGLVALQAEVVHTADDEYVIRDPSDDVSGGVVVDGAPVSEGILRTGTRIDLGDVRMSFFREEYADHGRPYGGRQGGELAKQRDQPARPAVG